MKECMEYRQARDLLAELARPVGTEQAPLEECAGRILGQDLYASEDVPAFDRSPYDGYAFCVADTQEASSERPAVLEIIEEIPAGAVPAKKVVPGTAAKILTGAPIPEGADAVIKYENTEFTEQQVKIFSPMNSGTNIVRTGEDVKQGQLLAAKGAVIDEGLAGTLAAQGIARPQVFRRPRIGLISTGNEVVDLGETPGNGKIYNSNRYTLTAALTKIGCNAVYLGIAGDEISSLSARILAGLADCDAVILTGGVSAGDYDLTPAAMEKAGAELLVHGVNMKPGMACAYGVKDEKLILGLSGNPAAALTNFYAVVLPALNVLCGKSCAFAPEITVTLADDFRKKSRNTRLLRGILDLSDGRARMRLPKNQGNVVISSAVGCNVIAEVPAGSGALPAGTKLQGILV